MHPAKAPTAKSTRQLDHLDEPIDPPAKAHTCQTKLPNPPAKPPTSKGKRAPYHRAKAHKSQASTHKRQAEAPKRQAEAPKSPAEAPKRPAKTAPWVQEYNSWAKAQNRPAEARNHPNGPYFDIYTCIHIEEVKAAAANDDIDGDKVANYAKYYMHSGQNFCVTCWVCPDCRHHCSVIEQHILHKSSHVIIQMHINQLKQHLINSSRYPVAI